MYDQREMKNILKIISIFFFFYKKEDTSHFEEIENNFFS